MEQFSNLIVVAGSGRNVGKTEFTCRLIRRFCGQTDIYGLKVSAIHPDEGIYHGDHSDLDMHANLVEETRYDLEKDTSRMLRSGASKVFYLQGDDEQIKIGFQSFLSRIPPGSVMVCESSSLWQFVQPGLLILVTVPDYEMKPRARMIFDRVSLVVVSDGVSGFPEIEKIQVSESAGWSVS